MEIAKAKVANALTSAASDHVIAVAADVYDETQEKYQNVLNEDFESRIKAIEDNGAGGGGDTPSFSGSAEDVIYNNTSSGLEAANVQGAIDELKKDIPTSVTEFEDAINYALKIDVPTESTVEGWGFTKGAYIKPDGGIPKEDLAEGVQISLGKADTALQEHQSLAEYAKKSEVEGEVSTLQEEINKKANQSALEALETTVSSNKSSLDSEISTLESKDAELAGNIETLSQKVTDNKSEVDVALGERYTKEEADGIIANYSTTVQMNDAIATSKTEITEAYTQAILAAIEESITNVLNTPI